MDDKAIPRAMTPEMTRALSLEWAAAAGLLILVLAAMVFQATFAPRFPGSATEWAPTDISLGEARALIGNGALVVDVRERKAAAAEHLPGAVLVPLEELNRRMAEMQVASDRTIVVYCGEGSALGPRAVKALNAAGYVNAYNLQPGLSGWRDAGLPTERS